MSVSNTDIISAVATVEAINFVFITNLLTFKHDINPIKNEKKDNEYE